MSEEERIAVKQEQLFFAGQLDQKPSPNCIVSVHLNFDDDGDLYYSFQTADHQKYYVCVVLNRKENLGWKHCRALSSVMHMAMRGTDMNTEIFQSCLKSIADSLGLVDGPRSIFNLSVATVTPGASSSRDSDPHTIISTGVDFDGDGNILLYSTTKVGTKFVICIQLHMKGMFLTVLEGEAFETCLQMLETGDVVTPERFMVYAFILKEEFNHVDIDFREDQRRYCVSVLPTSVEYSVPLPDFVIETVRKEGSNLLGDRTQDTPESDELPESHSESPYRGISYIRPLKESGQAQVYEGRRDSERVAVKVYPNASAEEQETFKNELKGLLKMSYHPNVVTVLDFFEKPEPAIAMEFVEGQDLSDFLKRSPRLEAEEALQVIIAIAEGLYHLHKNNIVHLDMKPANVMLRAGRIPVIIDLGLSAAFEKNGTSRRRPNISTPGRDTTIHGPASTVLETYHVQQSASGKGTILWMAPEMFVRHEWSDRTDVYAFGIIMWQIFSGKQPYLDDLPTTTTENELLFLIAGGRRPEMSHVSHVDVGLQKIMKMCWDADPKRRPTMMRVLDMLRKTDPKVLFESFDSDKNGALEYVEFVGFISKYAPSVNDPDTIGALFKAIDTDNSMCISFEEFEVFWAKVQKHGLRALISDMGKRKENTIRRMTPSSWLTPMPGRIPESGASTPKLP